jgi:signal transduction histidine kinase
VTTEPTSWWSALNALGRILTQLHASAHLASPASAIVTLLRHVAPTVGASHGAVVTYAKQGTGVITVHHSQLGEFVPTPEEDAQLTALAAQVLPRGVRCLPPIDAPRDRARGRGPLARWRMPSALAIGLGTRPEPTVLFVGSEMSAWPPRRIPRRVARAVGDLASNALGRIRAEHEAHTRETALIHVARVATVGEFAVSLAHELNQPLGAILASAEAGSLFLDADPPNVDRAREIVRRIAAEDGRAHQIILRMRALLRRSPVERIPVDPAGLVADVVQLVDQEVATRRLRLRVDVTSGLPMINGDRVQLQQVLLNLLLNAFDALGRTDPVASSGVLITALQPDARHVAIAVRDNGTGFAADAEPRLFEAFFSTKPYGLGMGLSICRSIVELHGGTMFHRNNPDRGATVGFTLPIDGKAR